MKEEKNERLMFSQISKEVGRDVTEAMLRAGYPSLLGQDLTKTGIDKGDAEKIKNLRQCLDLDNKSYSGSISKFEEELLKEAGEKLVNGNQVSSILLLRQATGKHIYVPQELAEQEFFSTLRSIKDFSAREDALESFGYGKNGYPAKDTLSREIEYLGQIDELRHGSMNPGEAQSYVRDIQEVQEKLTDKIFSVKWFSPTLGEYRWRLESETTRQGIDYALKLALATGVPVASETMQKAFEQILETEGMKSVRSLTEKTGIHPSRKLFDKYLDKS